MRLDVNLGDRLRLLRAARNLTQTDLAKRAGIERAALSTYESGKRIPRGGSLELLSQALKVQPDALQDDIACIRAMLRILEIPTHLVTGEPPPPPPRISKRARALRDLLVEILEETEREEEPSGYSETEVHGVSDGESDGYDEPKRRK